MIGSLLDVLLLLCLCGICTYVLIFSAIPALQSGSYSQLNAQYAYTSLLLARHNAMHLDEKTSIYIQSNTIAVEQFSMTQTFFLPSSGYTLTSNRDQLGFTHEGIARYSGSVYLNPGTRKITIGVGNGQINLY